MKKQSILVVVALGLATVGSAPAQSPVPTPSKPVTSSKTAAKPDFPSYTTVIKGYEQIISSMDKKSSLLSIYVRKKDQQMLGVLSAGFDSKKFFIATTVSCGGSDSGLPAGAQRVPGAGQGLGLGLGRPREGKVWFRVHETTLWNTSADPAGPADPADPAEPADPVKSRQIPVMWWQQLLLGPYLPHAPGARMT